MSESPYEIALRELTSHTDDIRPSDVVLFSEPLRSALNFVIRLGRFSLTDFSNRLGCTRYQSQKIAEILVKRNLFTISPDPSQSAEIFYESRPSAPSRAPARKPFDLWKKID